VVCGPTAVGKTACAISIAKVIDGEIISADSRQFYRELSIGTAKPSAQELATVEHHFINTRSIGENYTAGQFELEGRAVIAAIARKGKVPIVVGGSGLYIDALIKGLDAAPSDATLRTELNSLFAQEGLEGLRNRLKSINPAKLKTIDLANPVRLIRAIEITELSKDSNTRLTSKLTPPFRAVFIGLKLEREALYARINSRVDAMCKAGLEDEARAVRAFREQQALQTVGYKEWWPYFDGEAGLDETIAMIKQNSRRYAKRQMTWLRNRPEIKWFVNSPIEEAISYAMSATNTP